MGSKRRYKIGENPAYDQEFTTQRIHSRILNGGNQKPSVHTIIWSKGMAEGLLLELRGDSDGNYFRNGYREIADIPNCKKRLQHLEKRFSNYQQERINFGYRKPEQWPSDLSNEKLELEAKLDVCEEEAEFCEQVIKKFTENQDKEYLVKMLRQGPMGNGRLKGGILCELDWQKVENVKGVLVITEKTSPYYGISVMDYREKIAQPWTETRLFLDREKDTIIQRMMMKEGIKDSQMIEAAFSKRRHEMMSEHPEWSKLFDLILPDSPAMPSVPAELKNYLKE